MSTRRLLALLGRISRGLPAPDPVPGQLELPDSPATRREGRRR